MREEIEVRQVASFLDECFDHVTLAELSHGCSTSNAAVADLVVNTSELLCLSNVSVGQPHG